MDEKRKFIKFKKFSELSTIGQTCVVAVCIIIAVYALWHGFGEIKYRLYANGFERIAESMRDSMEKRLEKKLEESDIDGITFKELELKRDCYTEGGTSKTNHADGTHTPFDYESIQWEILYIYRFDIGDEFEKLSTKEKIEKLEEINKTEVFSEIFEKEYKEHFSIWESDYGGTRELTEDFEREKSTKKDYGRDKEFISNEVVYRVYLDTSEHEYGPYNNNSLYIDGEQTYTEEYLAELAELEKQREESERQAAARERERKREERKKQLEEERKKKNASSHSSIYSGSSNSYSLNDDKYDIEDYLDADDFADEWEEDFGDWDDAWDYYQDWEWEQELRAKGKIK